MEKQGVARIVTLSDLWRMFIQHLIPIILAALACMAAVFAYATFFLVPQYKSTAVLYILKQTNSNDYSYTQSDFNLALNIVNDCTYMVKSHAVLDKVIDSLSLNMSYKQLYSAVSIKNPDNTRILEVSVETDQPTRSKEIVDSICKYAISEINDTVGTNQISIHTTGTLENRPSNSIGLTKYVLVGIVAAVLVYSIFLVAFMIDDRIKSPEEIEKNLGLAVIGEISNIDTAKHQNKKYRYYSAEHKKGKHSKGGIKN